MSSEAILNEISELVLLSVEGKIDPLGFDRLEYLLKNEPLARQWYLQIIGIHVGLNDAEVLQRLTLDGKVCSLDPDILKALADYEKLAPVVETVSLGCTEPVPPQVPVVSPRSNKRSLLTLIASLAALVAMLLYLDTASFNRPRPTVRVADSWNARWADSFSFSTGDILRYSPEVIDLQSGIVKLKYEQGVEVILEGPVQFSCLDSRHLKVLQGRTYLKVDPSARGFAVDTQTSRIVDLGTEFGIHVDSNQITRLTMFKGKASVKSRQWASFRQIISQGQARQVDSSGAIAAIPVQDMAFVRRFDSGNNYLWRGGELRINLADILGNGNGLGSGQANMILDVKGEMIVTFNELAVQQRFDDYYFYKAVNCHPLIDSMFSTNVPDNCVQVTSTGLYFKNIPRSRGDAIYGIGNGRFNEYRPILNGVDYSQGRPRALYFMPSLGITFDLKKVGDSLGGIQFAKFTAQGGISESKKKSIKACADFWVLVDGQVRFSKMEVTPQTGLFAIEVSLSESDRFLSLTLTDGVDADVNIDDFCVWAEPFLIPADH